MFNNDKPIENFENDILGRNRFVKDVTKALINWEKKEPLVISICGTWGSGKTSVLNMIKQEIKENSVNEIPYTIINFNPWSYSNQGNLLDNFLDEFALQVKGKNKVTLYKEIIKYKKSLSYIPEINQINAIFSNTLIVLMVLNSMFINLNSSKIIFWIIAIIFIFINILLPIVKIKLAICSKIKSIESELLVKSPMEMKNKISEEIKNSKNKYIIIIDDIDRLDKEEIQELFKMVRNNIDFQNTIFLLAYDRDIVSKSLCVQEGINGDKYLNKIIQVDFCLPEIQRDLLDQYFLSSFEKSLKSLELVNPSQLNKEKLLKHQDIIINGILPFIKTIRNSKRLINSFEFYLNMSNNKGVLELNPIDLLGIETIRLFEFEYYNFIKNNESLFLGAYFNSYDQNEEDKDALALFNKSLEDIPINNRIELLELLKLLFPYIRKIKSISYYSDTSDNSQLRISNYLFFKAYFNFVPGGNDNMLCEFELKKLIELSNSYNSLIKYFETLKHQNKFNSLLSRLQDQSIINDLYHNSNLEILILAFFNSLSDIKKKEYKTNLLQQPIYIKLFVLIHSLFSRTKNFEKNYYLMKNIINKSDSIFCLTYFIDELENRKDLIKVVNEDQLSMLKRQMVNKIDGYSEFLLDDNTMNFILLKWKAWGNSEKYYDFIVKVKTYDNLFIKFFNHYVLTKKGYSMGNSINKYEEKYFDYQDIDIHIPIDFIYKRIEKLYNLPKYEKYKYNFDLFRSNFYEIKKNGLKNN